MPLLYLAPTSSHPKLPNQHLPPPVHHPPSILSQRARGRDPGQQPIIGYPTDETSLTLNQKRRGPTAEPASPYILELDLGIHGASATVKKEEERKGILYRGTLGVGEDCGDRRVQGEEGRDRAGGRGIFFRWGLGRWERFVPWRCCDSLLGGMLVPIAHDASDTSFQA